MSLKQDLKEVQNEFKSDEKILESAFRLEVFFRKYRLLFFVFLGGIIALLVGYQVYSYWKEKNALEITALFQEAKEKEEALKELKNKNQELYEFIVFSKALNTGDEKTLGEMRQSINPFIANFANYEFDSLKQAFNVTKNYGDFKDLVLLQEGYLYLMKKENKKAKELLGGINVTSELRDWSLRMEHYGIFD